MPDEPECRAEVAGQQKDHLVAVLWRTNRLTLRHFDGVFSMLGVVLGAPKSRRSGGAFLRQHNYWTSTFPRPYVRCFISGSIVSVSLDDMARVWTAIGERAHVGPAVRDSLGMRRAADNRDGQNRNQN
jgi:hypothetical protein